MICCLFTLRPNFLRFATVKCGADSHLKKEANEKDKRGVQRKKNKKKKVIKAVTELHAGF